MSRVWESRLDGKYDVFVDRIVNEGVLKIVNIETKEVLHTEPVMLSYGAIFGPDIDDVQDWADKAIAVVDNLGDKI